MENKEVFLKHVGANIRALRKEKSIEIKQVAKGLDISVQAYGAIENGKVDLNITRVFEIAAFYEVDISSFLNTNNKALFNSTSQRNKAGNNVFNLNVMKIIDESLINYLENELIQSKNRVLFLKEELGKIK